MSSLAAEFKRIFAGLDRAHGTYDIPEDAKPDARGKVKGRAITHPYKKKDGSGYTDGTVTTELWEKHLSGERALGITPIREDNTCVFGALDVDEYQGLDHAQFHTRLREMNLPLVVCRTKSGGAHLYLFCRNPVRAEIVRRKLDEWREALGLDPKTEIFPKQDKIIDEKDHGSWINIPYFGGEDSLRYAVGKRALTPQEFLDCVRAYSVEDETALIAIEPTMPQGVAAPSDVAELLDGGPPCLIKLAKNGFPEGSRNNALFSLAVLAKKKFSSDNFAAAVTAMNARLMSAPLDDGEVRTVIGSVGRKNYGYKCKDQPIVSVCDKAKCRLADYGVGGGASVGDLELTFGPMTKVLTKPVMWLWEINGELVEFATGDLMNQRAFAARVLETLSLLPPSIKPNQWRELVQEATTGAALMEVPDDATAGGQLLEFLEKFCTARAAGKALDELLMGRPYTDVEAGRSYFVAAAFVAYCIQHRFPNRINEREAYLMLRDAGLEHHRSEMKGKMVSYWSVPAFKAQSKDHDVPRAPAPEAM